MIEFPLPNGLLAYVQYVKEHREPPGFGSLIRILPDQYQERPEDLASLASQPELWVTFIPLGTACHRRYAMIVDTAPIPERFQGWPLFKSYNPDFATGRKTWFVWDGVRARQVGDLPPELEDLSMKETINLTELHNRIVSGWHPRNEVDRVIRLADLEYPTAFAATYWLSLPTRKAGEKIAALMREQGFTVLERAWGGYDSWLVLVKAPPRSEPEIRETGAMLKRLTEDNGGRFGEWGID